MICLDLVRKETKMTPSWPLLPSPLPPNIKVEKAAHVESREVSTTLYKRGEHPSKIAMFMAYFLSILFFSKIVHVLMGTINNRHNFYTSDTVLAWHASANLGRITAFPQLLFTFQCHIPVWFLIFFQQKNIKFNFEWSYLTIETQI